MSVTQPPPSNVPVRRSRIRSKTSSTTFLRRREQRGASAFLPCRGLLGFACRFRRFSSSAPFCFSSLVAARRLFDIVVINTKLSAFLAFAEPTRRSRRRSVSIFRRFDAFSPCSRRIKTTRKRSGTSVLASRSVSGSQSSRIVSHIRRAAAIHLTIAAIRTRSNRNNGRASRPLLRRNTVSRDRDISRRQHGENR